MPREPPIKSIAALRDLKRAYAPTVGALGEAHFAATGRSLPQEVQQGRCAFQVVPFGLSGCTALCVAAFRHAPVCLQSCALIAEQR